MEILDKSCRKLNPIRKFCTPFLNEKRYLAFSDDDPLTFSSYVARSHLLVFFRKIKNKKSIRKYVLEIQYYLAWSETQY